MIPNLVIKKMQSIKKAVLVICLSLSLTLVLPGIASTSIAAANAVTIDKSPLVIALGEGTGDKVQGQLEETIGAAKKNLGKATGQAEGAAQQVKGKAQKNMGEAKSRMNKASNDLERSSDNFIDAVKHFFGQ